MLRPLSPSCSVDSDYRSVAVGSRCISGKAVADARPPARPDPLQKQEKDRDSSLFLPPSLPLSLSLSLILFGRYYYFLLSERNR